MYDGTEGAGPGDRTEIAAESSEFVEAPGRKRRAPKTDADAAPISEHERRIADIDRLGDEIAMLSAQIQAATYELLVRLREFDRREGWGQHGAKSCAQWLAWRTSLDRGAAREWVRVARALEHLPVLSEAMRKGEVSYSKARALTRIATPETDAELVNLARAGTAAHIERVVWGCRRYGPKEERDQDRRMHDSRYLQVSRDQDGMYILRARLDPVAGAAFERALDAAAQALYEQKRTDEAAKKSACSDRAGDEMAPGQRRADALVLLAESALAGGLDPGTAGDRYQVVVHVDATVLADPAEQGVSALADGTHVSAETSRRVACDSSKVVMTHAADGSILDVGRKTRTISPALRRALVERDQGCRFPGCGLARCDAHHVEHWADGGATSLENTVLLCRFHHRLVHEEGFQLKRLDGGEVEFRTPRGKLLHHAPSSPRQPIDPFDALLKQLQDGGIVVDPYTGTPTWDGSPTDLGMAVEWFLDKTGAEPRDGTDVEEGRVAGDLANEEEARAPEIEDGSRAQRSAVAVAWLRANHWNEGENAVEESEVESDLDLEPSTDRLADLRELLAGQRPSALTYEFVASDGARLSFQEATFHPEFHREWNED